MTKRAGIAFLFFLAASVRAEFHFMVQGRLADSEGNPIGVQTAVEWRLYRDGNAADMSGTAVYRETGFITPVNALGVFSYELGTGTPVGGSLDLSVYTSTAPLYALLLVEGSELLPKMKVTPVPRSHVATLAESVATDSVDTPGLKNAAVTGVKIAAGAVSESHINSAARLNVDRIGLGVAPATSLDLSAKSDAVRLPTGTIAQRPATPANGDTRYNTETNTVESYVNGGWQSLSTNAGTVTSVTASTPLASSGGTTPVLSMAQADATTGGYLASGDWTTFNTKLAPTLSAGQVFVGNNSNIATAVPLSGDATMSSAGTLTLASTGTAGTYTKVTTDDKGRVTSGAALDAADIPNLDAAKIASGVIDPARIPAGTDTGKLALVGGTMAGAIDMGGNNIANAGSLGATSATLTGPVTAGSVVSNAGITAASATVSGALTTDSLAATTSATVGGHTVLTTTSSINATVITGDITGNAANVTGTVAVGHGGTGATDAPTARTSLSAAASGANTDITSLAGLTTPLSVTQGGIGSTTTTKNYLFAAPVDADGAPSFRALVSTDIPPLDASKTNSGVFETARIPDLDATKITSGVFDPARIPAGSNGSDRLPLAGGTMTGAIDMAGYNITNAGTVAASTVTVGGNPVVVAPSPLTSGSVLFADSATTAGQDNSNLFWDNTFKRLGIGTVTPTYALQVNGSISTKSRAHVVFSSIFSPYTNSISFTDNAAITRLFIDTNPNGGRFGVGTTTPTAVMHLKAGTAAANTAPLKFTAGTNLTTPEAGAVEFDGTDLYFSTDSVTRKTFAFQGSAGTLSGLTSGSVLFADSATTAGQDNSNLFWDNTNKRLGIGTVSPGAKLNIYSLEAVGSNLVIANFNGLSSDNRGSAILRLGPSSSYYTDIEHNFYNGGFRFGTFGDSNIINKYNNNMGAWGNINFVTSDVSGTPSISMRIGGGTQKGNVGIGTTSPTAVLHLKAGTAGANTAPLKFTAGTNLTTPEAGAVEFDGTDLYFSTDSVTRKTFAFQGSAGTLSGLTSGSVLFATGASSAGQDNSKLFWDNTNKRLGIGKLNPTYTLDITGDLALSGNIFSSGNVYTSNVRGLGVTLNVTSSAPDGDISFWPGNSPQMVFKHTGKVGIGTTSPTAKLHLSSGTSAANTAPLKFTAGTNLTTPEAGAVEFDGTDLYFSTNSTTRKTFAFQGSAGTLSGLTSGSVLFADSATSAGQDNSNLFWDNTNKRLGIGTASPGTKLDINQTTAGSVAIQAQNAGTVIWKVVHATGGITGGYNTVDAVEYVAKDSVTNRSINAAGTINASGADFAEWVDWDGPQPDMGSIVKYRGAYVVVSSSATAAFVGNDVKDPRHAILVAFAGQLPVWVKGKVHEGDLIVANGDGTGRAIGRDAATLADAQKAVGTAWASSTDTGLKQINVAVGIGLNGGSQDVELLKAADLAKNEKIKHLEKENAEIKQENTEIKKRLDQIEKALAKAK